MTVNPLPDPPPSRREIAWKYNVLVAERREG